VQETGATTFREAILLAVALPADILLIDEQCSGSVFGACERPVDWDAATKLVRVASYAGQTLGFARPVSPCNNRCSRLRAL
jgi:hypothetical protein